MPQALTFAPPLRVTLLAACLTLVTPDAWAQVDSPQDNTTEHVDLIITDACGGEEGSERLREELTLRLPDIRFSNPTENLTPWRIHWQPGDEDRCHLLVESDADRFVLDLGRDPEDEDIRFVASRVSWIISVDGDESGGLFGPDSSLEETEELARSLADDVLTRTTFMGADLAAAARAQAQEQLREAQIAADSILIGAQHSAEDALRAEEILRAEAAEQLANQLSGAQLSGAQLSGAGTRVTLLPGITVVGKDLPLPRRSLNLFGRNDAFHGTEFGILNFVDERGAGNQFALAANWIAGPFDGNQFALIGNSAETLKGSQFSTVFNAATEEAQGLQSTLGFNYALKGRGLQITPLINNVRQDWTGMQLGLLNVAGNVTGVQLGLINISRSTSVPIGLVNIALDYPPRLWAWVSAPGYSYSGVRGGGKTLRYGFTLGQRIFASSGEGAQNRTFGLNAGVHFPLTENLFADVDIAAMVFTNDLGRMLQSGRPIQQLRATMGWRLLPRVAPIAGLALTRMYENDGGYQPLWSIQTSNYQFWPELILGFVF